MLPCNVNKWINQVPLWGRTHLWLDRRSGNGSFNWHIPLFLFWIGSQAWWSRNCLTWWSVDVKAAAVRLGARSITAAACSAQFGDKLLLSGEQKTCPHQSCSQKASPSSWFWLLVYKTPNGLAVLCTSEKKCVWWEATRLPHFSADVWLDAHSPLTFLWVRKRCFFPHAGFCVSTPHLTHHFT